MEIINCEGYFVNHQLISGDSLDFTISGGLNWPHFLGGQIAINQKTKRLATWILGNFTLVEFDKFERGFPHCSENRVP